MHGVDRVAGVRTRLRSAPWSVVGVAFVLLLLTWPALNLAPRFGLDASWQAALHLAAHTDLAWGRDVMFTYGPLGFLQEPALYDSGLWMLSFAYQSLIHVALAISLLWVARRAFPLAVALAATYVLLVVGYLEGAVVLLAFYLAIYPAAAAGLAWRWRGKSRIALVLLFAAAWIATHILRRAGPRIEHRVWVAALLLQIALPACSLRIRYLWQTLLSLFPATGTGNSRETAAG